MSQQGQGVPRSRAAFRDARLPADIGEDMVLARSLPRSDRCSRHPRASTAPQLNDKVLAAFQRQGRETAHPRPQRLVTGVAVPRMHAIRRTMCFSIMQIPSRPEHDDRRTAPMIGRANSPDATSRAAVDLRFEEDRTLRRTAPCGHPCGDNQQAESHRHGHGEKKARL